MRRLNYAQFNRYLRRAEEIALEADMVPTVTNIYNDVLKPKADAYRGAFDGIAVAQSKAKKEGGEAQAAVKALEPHYRTARHAVLAKQPSAVLPKTLSAQPTDTDTLYAIEQLIDVVDDHVGEKWADDLLNGDFGKASAKAVKELSESIASNKDLAAALTDRAAAFGPGYEAFMAFKRLVRSALGASSKQYQRLHIRSSARGDGEEVADEPNEENAGAPTGNAAPGDPRTLPG